MKLLTWRLDADTIPAPGDTAASVLELFTLVGEPNDAQRLDTGEDQVISHSITQLADGDVVLSVLVDHD